MGQSLQPRVVRSGAYVPTVPRSGSEGDIGIWRKLNMITRGHEGHYYEQVYAGSPNLERQVDTAALTGTLAFDADSAIATGTGTLFRTECHLGQKILGIDALGMRSWLLVPKRIISDTQMEVWRKPGVTISGMSAYRMSRLFPVNDVSGSLLWGNVIKLDRGSYVSVGDGTFYLAGQTLQGSSLSATRHPQISILDPVTGDYANYPLGMTTSAPPSLAAVGGGIKGMQGGDYSMLISPARKETLGYNNPSERADVTIVTGDMVATTFPAMDTANGQNAWIVWVTTFEESLGGDLNKFNGPWFKLRMVDDTEVSPAGGTVNLEWLDAEVTSNPLVTFNNDPPPDAEFVEMLSAIIVFVSCEGEGYTRAGPVTVESTSPGPVIFPVKPNNIEAAPTELAFPTSPPETILGAISGPARIYLSTTNHLSIAQATGSDVAPVIIRPFWHAGFAGPDQVVFVNGNLYGFTVAGPARSVGDGDEVDIEMEWAADVAEIMDKWVPGHVLAAYHPGKEQVVFFHLADRLNDWGFWTTRWLSYGIPQRKWIGDGEYSSMTEDRIVSGVATVADHLEYTRGGRRMSS